MLSIKEAIKNISQKLTTISKTPRLDAELLLEYILKKSRADLFAYPEIQLISSQQKTLSAYVKRRLKGEPIAYILGQKEFWSLNLKVISDVLIPRPETEMLVEWILKNLPKDAKLRIADLGTGSGAVALAIAVERPYWTIDASDNSQTALKIAEINAKQHEIKNCNFYHGEWCQALPRRDYHAIVGNPPYISDNDQHLQQLKHEPREALAAGSDGLSAIKIIIHEARSYLVDGGWLLLEHGYDQAEKIMTLLQAAGYREIADRRDLAGLSRMVAARRGRRIPV
ncbi:peptide chain release factor N(5)-glutamine methyltransferase [Coxiella endosymbiont of Ornithodoros amblus]|uniref:peptide chain release factor N(5)-glutamine methyltransferase n=1 Tax=Coxiella endosymbiont of Ornithodoros amblus TaxID=1656166 RepID=UPI00244DBB07|nr:peptide chain release factor N(5)-glutamine methyltransferase [Coxiella endosymbiont of Ornithodoros amblus]MBW5802973.1 peptide chain release factor N(5)-glutamine methyltransferase [Coxiella endosymbiont of Ornithodoros amblus]